MKDLLKSRPPSLRPNKNGWTTARQKAFLAALGETGSVTAAARQVDMSRQSAYWLRRQPEAMAFRAAWDVAFNEIWQKVVDSAFDRVINGETEVFERDGVRIVRHRPCAPALMVRLLDRAIAARDKTEALENSEAQRRWREKIAQVRADIRALPRATDDEIAAEKAPNA